MRRPAVRGWAHILCRHPIQCRCLKVLGPEIQSEHLRADLCDLYIFGNESPEISTSITTHRPILGAG